MANAQRRIQDNAKRAGESSEKNSAESTAVKEQLQNTVVEQAQVCGETTESQHQARATRIRDAVGSRAKRREVGGLVQLLNRLVKIRSREIGSRDGQRFLATGVRRTQH